MEIFCELESAFSGILDHIETRDFRTEPQWGFCELSQMAESKMSPLSPTILKPQTNGVRTFYFEQKKRWHSDKNASI
jgi:hypothetical protein